MTFHNNLRDNIIAAPNSLPLIAYLFNSSTPVASISFSDVQAISTRKSVTATIVRNASSVVYNVPAISFSSTSSFTYNTLVIANGHRSTTTLNAVPVTWSGNTILSGSLGAPYYIGDKYFDGTGIRTVTVGGNTPTFTAGVASSTISYLGNTLIYADQLSSSGTAVAGSTITVQPLTITINLA